MYPVVFQVYSGLCWPYLGLYNLFPLVGKRSKTCYVDDICVLGGLRGILVVLRGMLAVFGVYWQYLGSVGCAQGCGG